MRRTTVSVLVLLLLNAAAFALGPHEVALLVNADSPDSRRIASLYQQLRSIPEQNVVFLKTDWKTVPQDMTPSTFRRTIMEPARQALAARGVDTHILAWVYAPDFPTRIATSPPMSLQGITLTRGEVPNELLIKGGLYASPLFGGPNSSRGVSHYSQTLDVSREMLGVDMPLPSMMLGYTGQRGNSVAEVEACLRRGFAADGTAPTGTVFFVVMDDIRSRCRQWQYHPTALELSMFGVASEIKHGFPEHGRPLLGISAGLPALHPESLGPYLPGTMAENLTSLGAVFETAAHTKLTEWIRAGATASCGTVTEPFALWMKFPHARYFVHYAAGCCALESFFQAVRCPLQLLIVGDPLCQPWPVREVSVQLTGMPKTPGSGRVRIEAVTRGVGRERFVYYDYFVDGRHAGVGPVLWLDTASLANGEHTVRVVAKTAGFVKQQCYALGGLTVQRTDGGGRGE